MPNPNLQILQTLAIMSQTVAIMPLLPHSQFSMHYFKLAVKFFEESLFTFTANQELNINNMR